MKFVYSVMPLLVLMNLVNACGSREKEQKPVPPAAVEEDSAPAPITSLSVSPEQMLSRPGDTYERESASTSNTARSVDQSRRKNQSTVLHVLYRYIDRDRMLSESSERPSSAAPADKLVYPGSLSEMVALSYEQRSQSLSNEVETWEASLKKQVAKQPVDLNKGPGFFVQENLFFDEEAMDVAVSAGNADNPEDIQRAIFFTREAEAKMDEGRLNEAADLYAQALYLFPDTTYINKQLGRISLMRGKYGSAIGYFSAALDGDEFIAETLNELGIAYLYSGASEKAVATFSSAMETDTSLVEPLYNMGLALRRLNRLKEARAKINEYLLYKPYDAKAYRELAMLDYQQTNTTSALAMLEQAMTYDDQWHLPYLDVAEIYTSSGRYLEALDMFKEALRRSGPADVLRVYSQPRFSEVRLLPECKAFEAMLADRLRKEMR